MNFVSKWKLSFKENYKLGVAYKEGSIQFSVLFSEKKKSIEQDVHPNLFRKMNAYERLFFNYICFFP